MVASQWKKEKLFLLGDPPGDNPIGLSCGWLRDGTRHGNGGQRSLTPGFGCRARVVESVGLATDDWN